MNTHDVYLAPLPVNDTIWKYDISTDQELQIPVGAQFLSIQYQNGNPCLWFLVCKSAEKKSHKVVVYGTGHDISDIERKTYIGTLQEFGSGLVWHFLLKTHNPKHSLPPRRWIV